MAGRRNQGKSRGSKGRRAAGAAFQPSTSMARKPSSPRRRRLFGEAISKTANDMFTRETLMNHMKHEFGSESEIVMGLDSLKQLNNQMAMAKLIPLAVGGFMQYAKSKWGEEPNKIGSPDMGAVFYKYIKIVEGARSSSQMKTAKKLYKSQNVPSVNTSSSTYSGNTAWSAAFTAAGEMRQGVYFPTKFGPIHGTLTNNWEAYAKYTVLQSGMLTHLALWQEIRNRFMTDEDRTWLDAIGSGAANEASSDRYFAIDYIEDEITIANAMEFSNSDVSVYICKCKTRTKYSPAQAWFQPVIETGYDGAGFMNPAYVYSSGLATVNFPGSLAKTAGLECYPYAACHVGATPFYSPTFRQEWEVLDVIKRNLKSTDKLTLKIKRELRNCISARDMEFYKNEIGKGAYNEGDYALLITHKGTKSFMKYTGGTVATGEQNIRETDVGPSKLMINNRSSFGFVTPNLSSSVFLPSTSQQTENYISGEGRILDVNVRTLDFDSEWTPEVVTNVYTAEGGPRD
jgi:hypothetical protein